MDLFDDKHLEILYHDRCATAFRLCQSNTCKKQAAKEEQRTFDIKDDVEGIAKGKKKERALGKWKGPGQLHQAIDLLEGIDLETGERLIKWKVILTHRGQLFANIHH